MTSKHDPPFISVKEFPDDQKLQIIHSYGGGGFRIAKQSYIGHQFIFTRSRKDWPIHSADEITADQILKMLGKERPDLVLLGLGESINNHLPELTKIMRTHAINLEVMATPAACRTWNLLLSEGRSVAAGLLAID